MYILTVRIGKSSRTTADAKGQQVSIHQLESVVPLSKIRATSYHICVHDAAVNRWFHPTNDNQQEINPVAESTTHGAAPLRNRGLSLAAAIDPGVSALYIEQLTVR